VPIVLIDRSHRWWFVGFVGGTVAALVLFWRLGRHAPGGLSGGSVGGMSYGFAGAALLVFALGLAGLRFVPKWWWIGSRTFWLRGHIWLGTFSLVLLLCHSGFRWGGLLERALWLVFVLTLATGFLGLGLQQFLPRAMTARVSCETPYEQIPNLCRRLGREADRVAELLQQNKALPVPSRQQLDQLYNAQVRPFLLGEGAQASALMDPVKAADWFTQVRTWANGPATDQDRQALAASLDQLEGFCTERRLLATQERLHWWLHAWLYVHVPLSAALVVLATAHALVAAFY
jgi:hypothetical protein